MKHNFELPGQKSSNYMVLYYFNLQVLKGSYKKQLVCNKSLDIWVFEPY